jgi:hypothetical protein
MHKRIPLSRLSLTLSQASLVLVGSELERASNEASMAVALRWSLRKDSMLEEKQIG